MKCKLKTLKGTQFEVEVEGGTLVSAVKELAAASEAGQKEEWQAENIKLIFQGKVLDNNKDLASYGIAADDFMVVMYSKPKKAAAPAAAPTPATQTPAPAPTATPVPAPAAATSPAPATTPAPAQAPTTPAPTPAPAPAVPAAEFAPEHEAAIQSLCEMGFPRDHVIAAMRAAFMNADRATQYLTEGMPTAMEMDAPGGDDESQEAVPETWEDLVAMPSFLARSLAFAIRFNLQRTSRA